jgi:hypothetical protein
MSFVTWLALPVGITLVASLIMVLFSHRPRTNTHQDIESFARFRGALARQMAAPPPPGIVPLSSSPRAAPPDADTDGVGDADRDADGVAAAPPAGQAGGAGSAAAAGSNLGSAAGSTAVGSNATVVEDRRRRPARPARTGVAVSPDR